jgi:hypothetical protein
VKFRGDLPITREEDQGTKIGRWGLFSRKVLHGGAVPGDSRVHAMSRSAEYVVDTVQRLVTVKFGRKVTFKEIERYSQGLRTNPAFEASFAEIVDLTEVKELYLQADEFLELADEIDPFSPVAKRAFVARTAVQIHAARMHKILRVQRNIEFSTRSRRRRPG